MAAGVPPPSPPARDRILAAAERRARTSGYNGFSFRDLAGDVGVKSPSIHYHFPKKADLAATSVKQYRENALASLGPASGLSGPQAFTKLAKLFLVANEEDNQMCLCGMLGAEANLLPTEVRIEVAGYFQSLTGWLAEAFEDSGSSALSPALLVSALEGALLQARVEEKPELLRACVDELQGFFVVRRGWCAHKVRLARQLFQAGAERHELDPTAISKKNPWVIWHFVKISLRSKSPLVSNAPMGDTREQIRRLSVIFRMYLEGSERTHSQAEIAREIGGKANPKWVRGALEAMQAAGIPLQREEREGSNSVDWTLPNDWGVGGVRVRDEDLMHLLQLTTLSPLPIYSGITARLRRGLRARSCKRGWRRSRSFCGLVWMSFRASLWCAGVGVRTKYARPASFSKPEPSATSLTRQQYPKKPLGNQAFC